MSPMTRVRITASIIYTEWISRRGTGNIAPEGKRCHDEVAAHVKPARGEEVNISIRNDKKEEIS